MLCSITSIFFPKVNIACNPFMGDNSSLKDQQPSFVSFNVLTPSFTAFVGPVSQFDSMLHDDSLHLPFTTLPGGIIDSLEASEPFTVVEKTQSNNSEEVVVTDQPATS